MAIKINKIRRLRDDVSFQEHDHTQRKARFYFAQVTSHFDKRDRACFAKMSTRLFIGQTKLLIHTCSE